MNIDSIRNGIVIDHIKAKKGFEIYDALRLGELDCSVAIITNAKSKKMGRKDIIKNDERVDKYHIELPKQIVNVIKCKNPRCITSVEQELDNVFVLADEEKRIYRCKYCESI